MTGSTNGLQLRFSGAVGRLWAETLGAQVSPKPNTKLKVACVRRFVVLRVISLFASVHNADYLSAGGGVVPGAKSSP